LEGWLEGNVGVLPRKKFWKGVESGDILLKRRATRPKRLGLKWLPVKLSPCYS